VASEEGKSLSTAKGKKERERIRDLASNDEERDSKVSIKGAFRERWKLLHEWARFSKGRSRDQRCGDLKTIPVALSPRRDDNDGDEGGRNEDLLTLVLEDSVSVELLCLSDSWSCFGASGAGSLNV